jgi:hypothetical protein
MGMSSAGRGRRLRLSAYVLLFVRVLDLLFPPAGGQDGPRISLREAVWL